MREKTFFLSPGAAVLMGFLAFTLRWQELVALLTAAAVHELGHYAALRWMRVPVYGLAVTASGPVLRCGESEAKTGKLLASLSGPAAGVLLWLVLQQVWQMCAEVSLLLSVVNLIPVLPLDGGRAVIALIGNGVLFSALGYFVWTAMIFSGLLAFRDGRGPGLLLFGVWLMLLSCQGDKNDII